MSLQALEGNMILILSFDFIVYLLRIQIWNPQKGKILITCRLWLRFVWRVQRGFGNCELPLHHHWPLLKGLGWFFLAGTLKDVGAMSDMSYTLVSKSVNTERSETLNTNEWREEWNTCEVHYILSHTHSEEEHETSFLTKLYQLMSMYSNYWYNWYQLLCQLVDWRILQLRGRNILKEIYSSFKLTLVRYTQLRGRSREVEGYKKKESKLERGSF